LIPLKGLGTTVADADGGAILPGLCGSDTFTSMPALTEKQKRHLRGLGHPRRPVVMLGAQGYTEAVRNELEQALLRHELLKVRVAAGDREARDAIIAQLCIDTGAELVQRIGNVALLYRRHPDKPRLVLPKAI
jgi:RNA-binding protein